MQEEFPPDDRLLAQAATGDRRAFGTLCRRHMPRVLALAERITGRAAEADDVAQEAFLKVWHKAPEWRAEGSARFSTWLYRIVVNLCFDIMRRRRDVPLQDVEEPSFEPANDERIDAERLRMRLMRAIDRLPAAQRTAMVLLYEQELSRTDAAQVMGISQAAFDSLAARSRQGIKKRLGK